MRSELLEQFLPPPTLLLPHQLPHPSREPSQGDGGGGGLSARGIGGLGIAGSGRYDGGYDGLAMLAREALLNDEAATCAGLSPRGGGTLNKRFG